MEQFAEIYNTAKVWANLDKAIETLSDNAIHELIGAMQIVKDTAGLDIRQDALLGMLKLAIKYR